VRTAAAATSTDAAIAAIAMADTRRTNAEDRSMVTAPACPAPATLYRNRRATAKLKAAAIRLFHLDFCPILRQKGPRISLTKDAS
jgi:hypothetical protein